MIMMTPAEVDRQVNALRGLRVVDCEAADFGAGQLRIDVLRAIADASPNAIALANAALATVDEDIGGD